MKIIPYSTEWFPNLRETVLSWGRGLALSRREIVDWYYANNDWCQLYLAVEGKQIVGTLGIESIPFQSGENLSMIGFGSNYHVDQDGIGGLLFMRWIRTQPNSIVVGGSEDTQKLITGQNWTRYANLNFLTYNAARTRNPGEPLLRYTIKRVLRQTQQKPPLKNRLPLLQDQFSGGLSLRQIDHFESNDVTYPSVWKSRIFPDIKYLNWRFSDNKCLHYRRFGILKENRTAGYIILLDTPQKIIVIQMDASSREAAAAGTMLALAQVQGNERKPVLLGHTDPALAHFFVEAGFKTSDYPCPVWFRQSPETDSSLCGLNYGMGDNDLRIDYFSP